MANETIRDRQVGVTTNGEGEAPDVGALIQTMGQRARAAAARMARADHATRARALAAIAATLRSESAAILRANAEDVAAAAAKGASPAMRDRLALNPDRIEAMAAGVEVVARLDDPLGKVVGSSRRPNGLQLRRIRVPLGVVGIIYESRPNVTVDAAALCLGAGNAVLLRGGSEAIHSNRAIHAAVVHGLMEAGLPPDAVQLVPVTDRAVVDAMARATGLIDLLVPRGGRGLVERVQAEARVPVLAHLEGVNHIYVHERADPAMAQSVVLNAKMRRVGVCGAMETLLIDRAFPQPAALIDALIEAGCEVRGDAEACALDARVLPASEADWNTEYLAAILSVRFVSGVDEAVAHITRHGSGHTDAIVTGDPVVARDFLDRVDSAIVMWNASTQFADGAELGLGAEIGIATGRIHARGPVGMEGLTSYKWQVLGAGQVRP